MIDQVYNSKILEYAGNIPWTGQMEDADATAKAFSKLCGSKTQIWLKLDHDHDHVADFSQEVKACALGQAASSIVARHIIGSHIDELKTLRADMSDMLRDNGPVIEGRFEDLKFLEPVREYKARHASVMLVFDALVDAIGQIEVNRALETT